MRNRVSKGFAFGTGLTIFGAVCTLCCLFNFSNGIKADESLKSWMQNIDDSVKLKNISMPGTHDSGALYSLGDIAGKCQDLSIYKQLEIGTRYLDIRLQLQMNVLKVVHGYVDEKDTGSNVFEQVSKFLKEHPSETVVMNIKEEENPMDSTISFDEALNNLVSKYDCYKDSALPILGSVRGKIVLFTRYSGSTIGVNLHDGWTDNTTIQIGDFYIQDFYKLNNNDEKKAAIKNCLDASEVNSLYTLNFFSGYLDHGFPPSYSVPVAKEINPWALNEIQNYHRVGTCIFDFITPELAQVVIGRNQ